MEKMSEMQKMMLDMMKWFHELCQANNIPYYIIGGTMLGAVRHSGFIPWDDDIDVGIPRKYYNWLLENKHKLIAKKSRYTIESFQDGNSDYIFLNAKVFDTFTTLVENNSKRTKRGIFIDVFPLDGIGDTKEESFKNYLPILRRTQFLMTLTCEVRQERSFIKNLAIIISRFLPCRKVICKSLLGKIDSLCAKKDFDSCEYVGNLVGNWGNKEIMLRSFFGIPKLYHFEDTMLFGPEEYDNYLKAVYKDWKSLPPKDKQKSEHGFLEVDLHSPYKNVTI